MEGDRGMGKGGGGNARNVKTKLLSLFQVSTLLSLLLSQKHEILDRQRVCKTQGTIRAKACACVYIKLDNTCVCLNIVFMRTMCVLVLWDGWVILYIRVYFIFSAFQ